MKQNIEWQKGLFSNAYKILQDKHPLGTLKCKSLSYSATAEFPGGSYSFKTPGAFNPKTQILDVKKQRIIGEITYDTLLNNAKIQLNGEYFYFSADNIWQNQWTLTDTKNESILQFENGFSSGQITSNRDQHLLLMCGLYGIHFVTQQVYLILFISLSSLFITLFVTLGTVLF